MTLCPLVLLLVLALPGDEVFDLNERAKQALDQGRTTDAVQLLESARRLEPDDETLTRNLAYAYYLRGQSQLDAFDFETAARDFRRASETFPDEPGYALHLASLQLRRYELIEAVATLKALVERHGDNASAHLLMGDALNLMDELEAALAAYQLAIHHGEGEVVENARRAVERTARQHAVEKDYETDRTTTFVIRHPPGTDFLRLTGLLDRARAEVCNTLDTFPRRPAIVVLYPPDAFRAVTGAHDWVGGLFDRKIRLPIGDPERDRAIIEGSFRHEFTHLIVSEIAPRCPTFVNEGLAQLVEHGRGGGMARLAAFMREAGIERDGLPPIDSLPETFMDISDPETVNLVYLQSYAFVDHVVQQHGLGAVMRWIRALASQPVAEAYEQATGRSLRHEDGLFRELVRTARAG